MSNLVKAMLAKSPVSGAVAVDDVFSTYVYEGNGSTQNIVNDIDLVINDGLVWTKSRTTTAHNSHNLYDTVRGNNSLLYTNLTNGASAVNDLDFNSTGFTVKEPTRNNVSNNDFVSWTFRKAPKFFDVQTISHINGVQTDVDVTDLGEVGFVTIKQTNSTSDWFTWHKDLTAGNNLKLNEIDAESSTNAYVSVSGTTISFSSSAPSGDYVVYAWAHDSDTDSGVIQCGSYTGNISKNEIPLDWEAQYVLIKRIDTSGYQWYLADNIRGMPTVSNLDDTLHLRPDNNIAEQALGDVYPTATGFTVDNSNAVINASGGTYIYIAIRRPMKVPESGSEVFAIDTASASDPDYTSGFTTDFFIQKDTSGSNGFTSARLIQGKYLYPNLTNSEVTDANLAAFDYQDGFGRNFGSDDPSFHAWMFKRAPGFMDAVCIKGDAVAGRVFDHNLTVTPELIVGKNRNDAAAWGCYHNAIGETKYLALNTNAAEATSTTYWNDTAPTATQVTLGSANEINGSGDGLIFILFATLAGISKVGSYTGNGANQDIDCGFVAGARFILIKRTDSTGDWWFWDSLRGISAGNDPALKLNDTAAQVSIDAVDPYAQGFAVNQEATTNINVNSAEYIFLAIA